MNINYVTCTKYARGLDATLRTITNPIAEAGLVCLNIYELGLRRSWNNNFRGTNTTPVQQQQAEQPIGERHWLPVQRGHTVL